MNTISLCLLLSFVFSMLKNVLNTFAGAGPVGAVIGIFSSLIMGPIPTVFNFFASPFVRWYCFLTIDVAKARQKKGKVVFEVWIDPFHRVGTVTLTLTLTLTITITITEGEGSR